MMLIYRQTIKLSCGFLGNAADQTEIFMIQLFQRGLVAVIIPTNQFLIGHEISPAFAFGGRPLGLAVLVIPQFW